MGLAWILHAGGAAVALEHSVDRWLSHEVSLLGGQAGGRGVKDRETGRWNERRKGDRVQNLWN